MCTKSFNFASFVSDLIRLEVSHYVDNSLGAPHILQDEEADRKFASWVFSSAFYLLGRLGQGFKPYNHSCMALSKFLELTRPHFSSHGNRNRDNVLAGRAILVVCSYCSKALDVVTEALGMSHQSHRSPEGDSDSGPGRICTFLQSLHFYSLYPDDIYVFHVADAPVRYRNHLIILLTHLKT